MKHNILTLFVAHARLFINLVVSYPKVLSRSGTIRIRYQVEGQVRQSPAGFRRDERYNAEQSL